MTTRRTLCVGPVDFANGRAVAAADRPFVLIDLGTAPDTGAPNSIIVTFDDQVRPYSVVDGAGVTRAVGRAAWRELVDDLRPTAGLRSLLADNGYGDEPCLGSLVPLFAVEDAPDGRHLYSQIRFSPEDALFIRTAGPAGGDGGPVGKLAWLEEAWARHQDAALFLNNHQRYYRRLLDDSEVEVKFTLAPDADIWDLNAEAYARICRGELAGFVPEYRDEFQQWDFPTRLYEVTAPEDERGYISFIPSPDGRHRVKQKRYAADAMVRKEAISGLKDLPSTTEACVQDMVGDAYRKLPAVRRVRYDVNFESLRTGHVYGIFFDRVSVIGRPDVAMCQCEVEYLRSRCIVPGDPATMFTELEDVLAWTRALLADRGVTAEEGFYSKLSFLRDVLADGRVDGDPSAGVLD